MFPLVLEWMRKNPMLAAATSAVVLLLVALVSSRVQVSVLKVQKAHVESKLAETEVTIKRLEAMARDQERELKKAEATIGTLSDTFEVLRKEYASADVPTDCADAVVWVADEFNDLTGVGR